MLSILASLKLNGFVNCQATINLSSSHNSAKSKDSLPSTDFKLFILAASCEVTLETTCRALGFNFTIFPNLFEESDQESAIDTYAAYFVPTIEGGCHEDVGYFLCAIQFPLCVDGQKYKPCRRLCNGKATID